MKHKDPTGKDALQIIAEFQKELLRGDKTIDAMYEEVRMMNFKIRPLTGNVLTLNLKDKSFIQALWNLGKLDEFFHRHQEALKPQERKMFFNMFDNLHERFEHELNKLNVLEEPSSEPPEAIEMEIFKEYPSKKKFN